MRAVSLLLLPLSLAAAPAHAAAAVVEGPAAAAIDTFLTRCVETGLQATVLVERDGRVVLHKGYGLADRAARRAATTETPYHLGSLGKQFTAAAILKLESEGRLRTSDSLARWFPGVPADKRAITIGHLLHQSSGLPYLPRGSFDDPLPMDSLVAEIMTYPLAFTPGERYQYSSPGYNLLAAIVERASGMRFHDYLRRALFAPAGMTATSGEDDSTRWVGALRTPSYSGDAPDAPIYPGPRRAKATGAGSIVGTTGDLWKWEQALRSHRVLDEAATAKLFAPAITVGPTVQYACAWNVAKSQRGTTVIMHGGDLGGFNVDMRRLVDEHATIVVLCNSRNAGRGYRDAVSQAITRFLFGPPPDMPPARVALAARDRARWATRWAVAPGDTIAGRVAGDVIWLGAWSQGGMTAIAGSDSAGRAMEARLDAEAEAAIPMLLAGDLAALGPKFHPSLPEDAHASFTTFWRQMADSVGAGAHADVIGTALTPPNGGKTLVRLAGAKGSLVLSLDWARGLLVNSEPVPAGALELPFTPIAGDRVARFDLWAGRTTEIARGSKDQAARTR